ncbi:hypothetical protein HDV03_002817 [Kappamyces sp. JEL0829]|nr:hypothetical protein HDV03_002817 [Kappamyces sp. JEL0829]
MNQVLFRDIGFHIIEYLEWFDVFNLIQTCRDAYRSFWTRRWQSRGRYHLCKAEDFYRNILDCIQNISWCEDCALLSGGVLERCPRVLDIVVHDAPVTALALFTRAESLYVYHSYSGFGQLGSLVNLRTLSLVDVRLESFDFLCHMAVLETLVISNDQSASDYLPVDWTPFLGLVSLNTLTVFAPRDAHLLLGPLGQLHRLRVLELGFFHIANYGFLAGLTKLDRLSLTLEDEPDAVLQHQISSMMGRHTILKFHTWDDWWESSG